MAAINEWMDGASLQFTRQRHGKNFSYNEVILTDEGLKVIGMVTNLGAFMLSTISKLVSQLMEHFLLHKPEEGPTPK